jgi:hypothetical protein
MNQPTMKAKTCTPLLPSLPHKRLRVAKKELDSENESALGQGGEYSANLRIGG